MADPINHDGTSGLATAGVEAAKWSLIGVIGAAIVGAAVFAGGAILAGGIIGGIGAIFTLGSFAGIGAGMGTMLTGALAPVTAMAALVGAGFGVFSGGAYGAIGGGLFGMLKGSERVSREKQAFREHSRGRNHSVAHKVNDAQIAGMQQGYMLGYQEGQVAVVNQIQQMAMQEHAAQAGNPAITGAPGAESGATAVALASAKCACGPHSEKIINEQAAAVTGPRQTV